MVKNHSKSTPHVVGHDILSVGGTFQRPNLAVGITEILKLATELRASPPRTRLTVHIFEDKDAARLYGIEPRAFYHADNGIGSSITIHVARLILVDGVGQSPTVQPVQTVVILAQFEVLCYTNHRAEQYEKDGQ